MHLCILITKIIHSLQKQITVDFDTKFKKEKAVLQRTICPEFLFSQKVVAASEKSTLVNRLTDC